ncbi:MAG: hypothetical protein IT539_12480 [Bradyrhizobiaceae bacterium]|nr:hypothetical protein [Bradyrhizobiaceae bacterium]
MDYIRFFWNFWKRIKLRKGLLNEHNAEETITEAAYEYIYSLEPYGFYLVVGKITVNWAHIEFQLDAANIALIRAGKTKERQLPKSLEPKIAHFEKGVLKHPDLDEFRARGEPIIAELHRLKEVRHDLIHGTSTKITEEGRNFSRFVYRDKPSEMKFRNYKFEELHTHLQEMVRLRTELESFVGRFWDHLLPNSRNNSQG